MTLRRGLILPLGIVSLILSACSSESLKPEASNVKLSRDAADEDCRDLGYLQGQTSSAKGTPEEALEDLKKTAALKGANYVQLLEYSGLGTAVAGQAYRCP